MQIKLDTVVKDLEGGDVANGRKCIQGKPPVWYTLKDVLCEVIQMDGLPVEPDEKLRLFDIGIRIAKAEEPIELSEGEVNSLLAIIKYHPSTLAVGRVTEALKK
jgi:hypothetical protein